MVKSLTLLPLFVFLSSAYATVSCPTDVHIDQKELEQFVSAIATVKPDGVHVLVTNIGAAGVLQPSTQGFPGAAEARALIPVNKFTHTQNFSAEFVFPKEGCIFGKDSEFGCFIGRDYPSIKGKVIGKRSAYDSFASFQSDLDIYARGIHMDVIKTQMGGMDGIQIDKRVRGVISTSPDTSYNSLAIIVGYSLPCMDDGSRP